MLTLKELRKEHWVEPTQWKVIEWTCSHLYIAGSTFYVISSVFFLPQVLETISPKAGPWCLIVGSLLFMIASMLNLMFLYTTTSPLSMQLLNASAVTCFGGSLLYLLGGIMYLLDWPVTADKLEEQIAGFLFVTGSLMWFFGCIFNIVRIKSARHFHFMEGGETSVLMKNQAYKVEMSPGPKERLIEEGLQMSTPIASRLGQKSLMSQMSQQQHLEEDGPSTPLAERVKDLVPVPADTPESDIDADLEIQGTAV